MKKLLTVTLVVVLAFTGILMTACSSSTYDTLCDEIVDHGKTVGDKDSYCVELNHDVTVYYFKKMNKISLSIITSSSGNVFSFSLTLDSKSVGIGEYTWSSDYTRNGEMYMIGGHLVANLVTSSSASRGFIEDVSKRSSNLSGSLARDLVNQMVITAESFCELALLEFQDFLEADTDLQPSDFGFNL